MEINATSLLSLPLLSLEITSILLSHSAKHGTNVQHQFRAERSVAVGGAATLQLSYFPPFNQAGWKLRLCIAQISLWCTDLLFYSCRPRMCPQLFRRSMLRPAGGRAAAGEAAPSWPDRRSLRAMLAHLRLREAPQAAPPNDSQVATTRQAPPALLLAAGALGYHVLLICVKAVFSRVRHGPPALLSRRRLVAASAPGRLHSRGGVVCISAWQRVSRFHVPQLIHSAGWQPQHQGLPRQAELAAGAPAAGNHRQACRPCAATGAAWLCIRQARPDCRKPGAQQQRGRHATQPAE